jgi:hypothetical protein
MPSINLGPFGRFTLLREKAPEPPRAPSPEFIPFNEVDKVRIDRLNAPPSYSLVPKLDNIKATPASYSLNIDDDISPSQTSEPVPWRRNVPKERIRDMKRWLIEIVALNLEADFDALNAALGPDDSNAWRQMKRNLGNEAKVNARNETVLSSGNQDSLQYSANKICKIHQLIQQDRVPDSMDAWIVFITFIEPSRKIDPTCEDFVMDLLGWYNKCCAFSSPRNEPFKKPWEQEEETPDLSPGLCNEYLKIGYMRNFKKLIARISLNTNVKLILENALENYSQVGELGTIEARAYYSPVRRKYNGLSRVMEVCQIFT